MKIFDTIVYNGRTETSIDVKNVICLAALVMLVPVAGIFINNLVNTSIVHFCKDRKKC
jgi:hypothetical protein